MSLARALDAIRSDPDLGPQFVRWETVPASPARTAPYPCSIDLRLVGALRQRGIDSLYTHQARAIEAVLGGEHVAVVTPTASGKTLCYNVPVLQAVLVDGASRALYLFPTKALAQDQVDELQGLISALGASVRTYTYDGDTPSDARRAIREAGHVVVTNPDMLHTGILPHHTKWMKLFENLRYVVIDELHQYRGVFGSNVANVIRRLRRVCRFYGSDPLFICCSATIANPKALAEGLVGSPVTVVDESGAPRGEKTIAIYNPPVVNRELGIRRSAARAAQSIAGRLLREGVQTIVFAPSRLAVELTLRRLRDGQRWRPGEEPSVEGYRGGYLPKERRAIEAGLRNGRVRAVVATNALELGIDIGGLEAAVLQGYPGTVASAWQQMGRAGRRDSLSFAVLVANSSPLNQYLARNPQYLFDASPESAWINPDNLAVLIGHLKCAAFELPFEEDEEFGAETTELLGLLAEEGILHGVDGRYHWMADSYPAEQVSLRSAAIDNFVVIEQGPRPRVIGEVDRPAAPLFIHEEAIYMHGGRQYHVDRLDWHEKKAYVRPVDVDYYTDANLAVDLKVLETAAETAARGCRRAHGDVAVTFLATVFKKIKLDTGENVGWGKISLPQEDLHTTGYWLALESAGKGLPAPELEGGLWGLAHLLSGIAPLFLMCDPKDLQAVAQVRAPFTGAPTVYLYESVAGGVGLARGLYDAHPRLVRAAYDLAAGCPCADGCPSCVGPGADESMNTKAAAMRLLEDLIDGGAA